jgi:hypothetical protein
MVLIQIDRQQRLARREQVSVAINEKWCKPLRDDLFMLDWQSKRCRFFRV